MKRIILTAFFLVVIVAAHSQKLSFTYYNDQWLLTTKNAAKYYRAGIIDSVKYRFYGEVKDYYMTGKLQMKGYFRAGVKVDTFYFYYPSGQLMKKGRYVDNKRYGVWTSYYENGNIKDRVVFNGDFIAAIEYNSEDGTPKMIKGTGAWKTEYHDDISNASIAIEAAYKDTLRHGTWNYYNKKDFPRGSESRLECTEVFQDGVFVNGKYYWAARTENLGAPIYKILPESKKFYNTENWKYAATLSVASYPYLKFLPKAAKVDSTTLKGPNVFYIPDEQPEFPGGFTGFQSYIKREFNCKAANWGTAEKIWVAFVIDTAGFVKKGSVTFDKGTLAKGCKEKLAAVLEASPKWKPGYLNEPKRVVLSRVALPIELK